jgi:MarR family transcriptional regulator for hemolysin
MDIEERFSYALHNTARAWRQAVDRRLKDLGLSQASWMAIATLAKAEPLSQTELASRLGVEDPTMVSMIDRMVKAGYMLRQPSPTDRRVKLVHLTDEGRAIYLRVRAAADPVRRELLGGVDRSELERMTVLLEALHARLNEPGGAE